MLSRRKPRLFREPVFFVTALMDRILREVRVSFSIDQTAKQADLHLLLRDAADTQCASATNANSLYVHRGGSTMALLFLSLSPEPILSCAQLASLAARLAHSVSRVFPLVPSGLAFRVERRACLRRSEATLLAPGTWGSNYPRDQCQPPLVYISRN